MSRQPPSKPKKNVVNSADQQILENKYEFIPSGDDKKASTWQDRMVQTYQDALYREYALADLSRPGQLGLRWRTRQEVVEGRGNRTCGNKRCTSAEKLTTLEVPFTYQEAGQVKKELVKLRLCQSCRPLVKASTKEEKSPNKSKREANYGSDSDDSSSSDDSSERRRRRRRKRHSTKRKKRKHSQ